MTSLDTWREWAPEEQRALRDRLADRVRRIRWDTWQPYPWQVPPATIPVHGTWLMLGGRGTGKTDGIARYVVEHINGPPCDPRVRGGHRIAIVAPTLGDAAESCVNGPSGIRAHDPTARLKGGVGGGHVLWPSGAEGKLFGAYTPEDVERLRAGGNRCLVWLEEVAAMRHLGPVLEHTGLGLRIGSRPHYVASTTPKPRKELRALLADPTTITTTGRTSQAWHLPAEVRDRLYRLHRGTRLERQELEGVLIEAVEGALWSWQTFDRDRVQVPAADLTITVSIDPAVSNTETSDETGIVVLGATADRLHGYVLEDLSGRYSPEGWAKAALEAAERWDADYLVAEKNQGGDMVGATLRSVDRTARVRLVTASKGKRLRAEPISALYDQGRVHHVGGLVLLEEQMTTWVPGTAGDAGKSPDRVDALVHGLTDLMVPRRSGGFADAA